MTVLEKLKEYLATSRSLGCGNRVMTTSPGSGGREAFVIVIEEVLDDGVILPGGILIAKEQLPRVFPLDEKLAEEFKRQEEISKSSIIKPNAAETFEINKHKHGGLITK